MMTTTTQSPCYKCKDRHMNCHSDCDGYSKYREVHEQEMETIMKNRSKSARTCYMSDRAFKNAQKKGSKVFKQHKK